jgi:hypothetical protein
MAPRVRQHPGTRPTATKEATVDEKSLAHTAYRVLEERDHKGREERGCFYCLEGWVFLGSLDHDGEEIVEAIRCRKCGGTGKIKSS